MRRRRSLPNVGLWSFGASATTTVVTLTTCSFSRAGAQAAQPEAASQSQPQAGWSAACVRRWLRQREKRRDVSPSSLLQRATLEQRAGCDGKEQLGR